MQPPPTTHMHQHADTKRKQDSSCNTLLAQHYQYISVTPYLQQEAMQHPGVALGSSSAVFAAACFPWHGVAPPR